MLKLLHTEKIKIKKYIQEIFNDMPQAKHPLNAILEKYFQFLQIAINTFIFKFIKSFKV